MPSGGGPVHWGPQRPGANQSSAGPAAQNNPPPAERTTSFLLPGREERIGREDRGRKRRVERGDPFTETQNVGLWAHENVNVGMEESAGVCE